MVRAADTHRLESAASCETWGRSHLLFQGDDVIVAREVPRQAQSQVVGLGAAVQRGAKVTPVTESPQNTQLKDGARARGSASPLVTLRLSQARRSLSLGHIFIHFVFAETRQQQSANS